MKWSEGMHLRSLVLASLFAIVVARDLMSLNVAVVQRSNLDQGLERVVYGCLQGYVSKLQEILAKNRRSILPRDGQVSQQDTTDLSVTPRSLGRDASKDIGEKKGLAKKKARESKGHQPRMRGCARRPLRTEEHVPPCPSFLSKRIGS